MRPKYDTIVVGAGIAGIVATRDLAEAGHRVLLVEAKDHVGGRAWSRPFEGTDLEISLGGAYLQAPHNTNMMRELERYGVEVERAPEPQTYVNLVGGQRVEGGAPVPPEEWIELERAYFHILSACKAVDPSVPIEVGVPPEFDISWKEFISPLELSPATRDFVEAFFQLIGGAPPSEFSAALPLYFMSHLDHSVISLFLGLDAKVGGGNRNLYDAMLGDATANGAEVVLSTPVRAIRQVDNGVVVVGEERSELEARTCIVAVPLSTLPRIEFDPRLPEDKSRAANLRPSGTGQKSFVLVEDAPPALFGIGNPKHGGGLVGIIPDGPVGSAELLLGFASDQALFDISDPDSVQRAYATYMPGCRVVASDGHDWRSDPYADGTWMSPPPGSLSTCLAPFRAGEGNLVFATADIAKGQIGQLDGAVESGAEAAVETARRLLGTPTTS